MSKNSDNLNNNNQPNDLLFARQPIFDKNKKLYGYELLYRDKDPNVAFIEDGDKATNSLIVNYCSGILNEDLGAYVKVFLNLTRGLLLSDYFFPLEPKRIVVEILEDIKVDDELLERIKFLKSKGYQFALDDYEFNEQFDQLLPLVDYIKVELLNLPLERLKSKMVAFEKEHLNKLKKRPILLAEKVEDQETCDVCAELGFDLFQGYFLEKPSPVYGKRIESNAETALQIVSKLQDPEIDIDDLSHSISMDAKLSYQILKIVNSPLCRLPKQVSSLHEAVVFLGLGQIKKWAMAMALSGSSSQSKELFRILLTRARTCEIIAEENEGSETESYFTMGLFSGIDAVMLADKEWLLDQLDLARDLREALISFSGTKGDVLRNVLALEKNENTTLDKLSLTQQTTYFTAREKAITWTQELFAML